MGLAHGAPFLQHLPEQRPGCQEHRDGAEHVVRAEAGSKLASSMGVDPVMVVSRHHQALADAPATWQVVARDEQELVEGIEGPHPPLPCRGPMAPRALPSESPHGALLRAFVEAARAAGTSR